VIRRRAGSPRYHGVLTQQLRYMANVIKIKAPYPFLR